MPIIFKAYNKIEKAQQNRADVIRRLRSFIHAKEPALVYWLTNMWRDQQQAITYKELREAILNGGVTIQEIEAWQHDYSIFVTEKLLPVWIEAMEEAAAQITKEYPDFIFNRFSEEVRKWTEEHAAELVTNCTNEQKKAINALIQKAAVLEDVTVDELSRAIRPLIGLTQRQAVANLNFYNALRANGFSHKQAQEKSLQYAERQHRYRAMVIARTELANAYNNGEYLAVKQAQNDGLMGTVRKRWVTAGDDRVCEYCKAVDGAEVEIDELFPILGGKNTPTAHPSCRCSVIYIEIEPPQYQTERPQVEQEPAAEEEKPEDLPKVPPDYPMPKGLKYKGRAYLGGTGEMHIYEDEDGNEWLFKPAQSKAGKPEPFRAYVQEAAYKVQYIINPETAVPVRVVTLDGRLGAIQKRIKTYNGPNLSRWQDEGGELPQFVFSELQREHITDWLLCNFDSHGRNFIFDENGNLIGIDKEQSFRYIYDQKAWKMSLNYHPNAYIGEQEPIYNTMFRRFVDGEIDLNLQDSLTYIKRIEAISDTEYREIFRPYAEALKGKGKEAEELLDMIVDRKRKLRETVREFYSDLLTVRTGKKVVFKFADEVEEHLKQPIAGVLFSKETLEKMSKAELKQIAKNKKIPYYANMTKEQLIIAISDPAQAPIISKQVKEALDAARARRTRQTEVVTGELNIENLLQDMDIIPKKRLLGISIPSDGTGLENMQINAKRLNTNAGTMYEITGKMTQQRWQKFLRETAISFKETSLKFRRGQIDWDKSTIEYVGVEEIREFKALQMAKGNVEIEIITDEKARALLGQFRITVRDVKDGVTAADQIKKALKSIGLDDLFTAVDHKVEEKYKAMRILWQVNPREAYEVGQRIDEISDAEFEKILKQNGITRERIKRLKLKEVFEGYSTYVDEEAVKEYIREGAEYLWHSIGEDPEAVIAILKSPGLMSTTVRFQNGIIRQGLSSIADIETGGADNVFTRLAPRAYKGKRDFADSFGGWGYRILIDPKELARTDWYAYTSDEFGTTSEFTFKYRPSSIKFIREMNSGDIYYRNNEVMFRKGIPKSSFIGVAVDDEYQRQKLIQKLKEAGITEVNGIKIEKFIKVQKSI